MKGESRMIRLQFEGSSRSEAVDFCSKAVERLQEYTPVPPAPPAANHTTETQQQQQTPAEKLQAVPDVSQESLSIKHLAQYFMGERGLSLPLAYHQFTLPPGDVEDLLRLCFLDSGFPAFVEEVENKLKALLQE
uniref:Si:ch1073-75f15.2 n=1 Tax=Astyanax mexicanus TaxID=7994 RepID=A0A8B9HGJ6_ASTMX